MRNALSVVTDMGNEIYRRLREQAKGLDNSAKLRISRKEFLYLVYGTSELRMSEKYPGTWVCLGHEVEIED